MPSRSERGRRGPAVGVLLALVGLGACDQSPDVPRAAAPPPEATRPLLRLPDRPQGIREWMKARGWETQRGNPRHFRVDGRRLEMVSRADSVAIAFRRGFPLDPRQWPYVRFRFRVITVPAGTNLAKKGGDDAAFRLYVAFDRDQGWLHPPHTIAYAWTETAAPGTVIRSPHFDQLRYLSIGKGAPPQGEDGSPRWITVERDLAADYRRLFPEVKQPVPALSGIMLKCDSNNTGTAARAEVAAVELLQKPSPGRSSAKKPAD